MPTLLSHCWRILLIAALVLNPIAGASAAMLTAQMAMPAAQATAPQPPCHEMAGVAGHKDGSAMKHADPAHPGGDCGRGACQSAACCLLVAFELPTLPFAASTYTGAQALPAFDVTAVPAPPPARIIRPPIA